MCVTNVYIDRYPDGKESIYRQTAYCTYSLPGRPCAKLSTLENPVRKIQFGEPSTEYIMTTPRNVFPLTPPRSSGGSHHRISADYSSAAEEGKLHRRASKSKRSPAPALRPTRTHRKERIIIVDSPPTPRTPPQTYNTTFTAPSSPANPPFIIDGGLAHSQRERGRPIIVDERPFLRHPRVPSIGAVVSDRPRRARSQSRPRGGNTNRTSRDSLHFQWDSPSSSHTSFDSRARREAEEVERRAVAERDARIAALEAQDAERRRADRIAEQDARIRSRPAVPIPPRPLRQREYLEPRARPVVQQDVLLGAMGGLNIRDDRVVVTENEMRRRLEERERVARARLQELEDQEALNRRLRERQMPKRRFSVGPGGRRHRVLYDDGVYRWE